MKAFLLVAALACACQRDFGVAPPVAHPPPSVGSFTPAAAYAGARVTVTAKDFGASAIEVHFGGSRAVSPLSVGASSLVVQVPDDATSGPITVVSSAGRDSTHDSFTALGLGHLRQGRIAGQADLRSHVAAAVPFNDTEFAVVDDHYSFAGTLTGSGRLKPLDVRRPAAIAAASATGLVIIVDTDWNRAGCSGSAAHLLVFPPGDDTVASSTCLPMPAPLADSDTNPMVAAVDENGTHALVIADTIRMWLLDLTATPPVVRASADLSLGFFSSPGAVWVGGTRFVYLDAGDLRSIDWSAATPAPTDAFVTTGTASAMAANNAGKLVYAGSRSIYLVDVTAWPPTETAHFSTLTTADPSGLAVNGNFTRAAVALHDAGRVVTYDLAALAPLVSTPVEEARQVSLAPGAFLVSARGGVALLSQTTGEPVGAVDVKVNPGLPVMRALPGGATFVDVPLQALGTLARLDPLTLQEAPWKGTLPLPPLIELFPLPDGGAVYRHGSELRRSHLLNGVETEDLVHVYPAPSGGLDGLPLELGLSADGTTLLLQWGEHTGLLSTDNKLALLDVNAQWTATSAVTFDEPGLAERAIAPDAQHLVLVQDKAARVLDLPSAKAGTEKELWKLPLGGESVAATFAGGLLFDVFFDAAAVMRLQIASASAPAVLAAPPVVPGWQGSVLQTAIALTAAPGGRRLYWLMHSSQSTELRTLEVDPDTGAVGPLEPSLSLPSGSDLLPYPDGEHMIVVDRVHDQLILLE